MKLSEVPRECSAVQCLRCREYLAMPPGQTLAERQQAAGEHHLYLCANPTPNVVAWRRAGFPQGR